MRERLKGFQRLTANPLGGRIRGDELRKACFQIDKLLVKPIIFAVADRRCGFLIVAPVVLLKLPAKSVYELPIPRVQLGPRRIRWRPADVRAFIVQRTRD